MEHYTLTKDQVLLMFLELNDVQDEDPWDNYNEYTEGAQGIICALRAIATNAFEAEDWALEYLDHYRAERYKEE